jgi:hypothetical protein
MRENSDDVETQEHKIKLKISKANRNVTKAIKLAGPKASGKLPGKSKANASGDIANVPQNAIDADSERISERRRLLKGASYLKAKGKNRNSNLSYPSAMRNVSARRKVVGKRPMAKGI